MKRSSVSGVVAALAFAFPAFAAELHVPAEYDTIQAAIERTEAGDEVIVADGVYTSEAVPMVDFLGKAITVRSANGPSHCILRYGKPGMDLGLGVRFRTAEGPDSVLEGFTLDGEDHWKTRAVYCQGASPTIRNCIIERNPSYSMGGALGFQGSQSHLSNCVIRNNRNDPAVSLGDAPGGGINCFASELTLTDCILTGNSTASGGGALWAQDSTVVLSQCVLARNAAGDRGCGGAVYLDGGLLQISHSVVARNDAYLGAAMDLRSATVQAHHSIFWDNASSPELILPYDSIIHLWQGSQVEISWCAVQGGQAAVHETAGGGTLQWGEGNMDVDPGFLASGEGGEYRLRPDSACIDAGDPAWQATAGAVDLDGQPRVLRGQVDIGADEAPYAGDFEPDDDVDADDLAVLAGGWMATECEPFYGCGGINLDEASGVDLRDFAIFAENWLIAAP